MQREIIRTILEVGTHIPWNIMRLTNTARRQIQDLSPRSWTRNIWNGVQLPCGDIYVVKKLAVSSKYSKVKNMESRELSTRPLECSPPYHAPSCWYGSTQPNTSKWWTISTSAWGSNFTTTIWHRRDRNEQIKDDNYFTMESTKCVYTINPRSKPRGLINFIIHNHPGSNRERNQIEIYQIYWFGWVSWPGFNSRPGLYSRKYGIHKQGTVLWNEKRN